MKLEKLNETIIELEQNSSKLKSQAEIFKNLAAFKLQLEKLSKKNTDVTQKISSINENIENEFSKLRDSFYSQEKSISSQLRENKSDIKDLYKTESSNLQIALQNSITAEFVKLSKLSQEQNQQILDLKSKSNLILIASVIMVLLGFISIFM